jgi:hypothetical protein
MSWEFSWEASHRKYITNNFYRGVRKEDDHENLLVLSDSFDPGSGHGSLRVDSGRRGAGANANRRSDRHPGQSYPSKYRHSNGANCPHHDTGPSRVTDVAGGYPIASGDSGAGQN